MASDFTGSSGEDSLRSVAISIPERPIEAGSYSWGWVDYSDYGQDGRPNSIHVTMLADPRDGKSVAKLRRWIARPHWLNMLLCYGPVTLGALVVSLIGNPGENSWLSHLALVTTIFSGWQVWKQTRNTRLLSNVLRLDADRNLENYSAGRRFLELLSAERLHRGELSAYFNLRAQTTEIAAILSDDGY